MADPQSDIFIRDGKAYVAIDHLNTVLASAPDNPSQATVTSTLSPGGRLRCSLQLRPVQGGGAGNGRHEGPSGNLEHDGADIDRYNSYQQNVVQHGSAQPKVQHGDDNHAGAAHNGIYQNAHALVEQLKDLQPYDKDTLDQLLTDPHPPALSELAKAEGSLVPLATANNGRVFYVLIGNTIKSDWEGDYPMKSFRALSRTRTMVDPMTLNGPITPRRATLLKMALSLVKGSLYGSHFRASVEVLWPEVWAQYTQLIERPVDISLIQQNLDDGEYETMVQVLEDLELLRRNTTTFFGPGHRMSSAAAHTVDIISYEMGRCSAGARQKKPTTPSEAEAPEREQDRLQRGPIREMVYRYDMHVLSERHDQTHSRYPLFVIPLGRVCVAQSPDDEIYATNRVVVMDIASAHQALWLVWDYFTINPIVGQYPWLPNDLRRLLNAKGQDDRALYRLTDDIKHWDVFNNDGSGDSRSSQPPEKGLFNWGQLNVPGSAGKRKITASDVLLDRTWKKRIVEAVNQGWGEEEAVRTARAPSRQPRRSPERAICKASEEERDCNICVNGWVTYSPRRHAGFRSGDIGGHLVG